MWFRIFPAIITERSRRTYRRGLASREPPRCSPAISPAAPSSVPSPIQRYNLDDRSFRRFMLNQLGYLSLALYAASFCCYARILYAPHLWLGRLASTLLA